MARSQETEHELDTAVLECKEFDEHTVSILDENTMLRAGLGEQVAVVPAAVCKHGSAAVLKSCRLRRETVIAYSGGGLRQPTVQCTVGLDVRVAD